MEPGGGHQRETKWSAPAERIVITALLALVLIASLASLTILGLHHDIDKAGLTAVLGTIAGGAGAAMVHKLSSRG